MPGPSPGAVALVVALDHDLGDEVEVLVLVVPLGAGRRAVRSPLARHHAGTSRS